MQGLEGQRTHGLSQDFVSVITANTRSQTLGCCEPHQRFQGNLMQFLFHSRKDEELMGIFVVGTVGPRNITR